VTLLAVAADRRAAVVEWMVPPNPVIGGGAVPPPALPPAPPPMILLYICVAVFSEVIPFLAFKTILTYLLIKDIWKAPSISRPVYSFLTYFFWTAVGRGYTVIFRL